LHLAGEVTVEIWCNADQPSYDISAILSQVYPDGKSYNLTQGYLRVETSQNNLALQISLQATCVRITQGNALRLSISGACFPAYALNFGTSKKNASLIDAEIITLSVSCGGDRASRILLPVVAAS
jgi:putative CocE/NonD family hydrolase